MIDSVYKEFGIRISRWILRYVLESKGFVWKRIRQSLKSKRVQKIFDACHKRLKSRQKRADKGELDLFYFDEAGFNLTPSIPYAL